MIPLLNTRFQQALEFAALAHQNQLRKGTAIPYITHPVAVVWILQSAGCEEDVIIAGLLHDVVEDAQVSLDLLCDRFGERVAGIIKDCSEADKTLPWIKRKEQTIEHLFNCDDDCRAVAAADKLHNAQCMLADLKTHGNALWTRFKQGRHHQAWYYGSVLQAILNSAQSSQVREIAFGLHRVLDELFNPDFETRWQVHPDRRRFIRLSRSEAERRQREEPASGGDWILAVEPETLTPRLVVRLPNGFVPDVEGHEDLFPLKMVFKHEDGFMPGGDWLTASTPDRRLHDGRYRSYFITWSE
jgi:hypothetical protein